MHRVKTAVLIIMDGWGIGKKDEQDAVHLAKTPWMDRFGRENLTSVLDASGESVGLPDGQMGNSEVGHLNLGAGRVVYQELVRIGRAIKDGSFFENEALTETAALAKHNHSAVHVLGLLSDGGVHSHIDHVLAMVKLFKQQRVERVYLHCFLDGRDTPPQSAIKYVTQTEEMLREFSGASIATIGGRYYGMDRDNRWARVKQAHDAIVSGEGQTAPSAVKAVKMGYGRGEMDELMLPTVILDSDGAPVGRMKDGDVAAFANFRADRAREITRSLIYEDFDRFERGNFPKLGRFVCMTEYQQEFSDLEITSIAFPMQKLDHVLGAEIEAAGRRQFHTAETEKYAHVTFFFNGGVEEPFEHEDRTLIPSPSVATYDMKPEMSAYEVRDVVVNRIHSRQYAFIVVNFANADMVGHTGKLDTAIKAVETVDECVGEVVKATLSVGGCAIITSDHGNAEQMWDESTKQSYTAHTTNPVPLVIVGGQKRQLKKRGKLADVAPTVLTILGLEVPPEMTGEVLFTD